MKFQKWMWVWLFWGWLSGICLAEPPQWPQWRGPHRDGKVSDQRPWPRQLQGEALQQVWRVELAPSYSGPIVAADRVFVTETVDKKFERVQALDRATGKTLWTRQWEGAMSVPFFAKSNGDWIRGTPAYDGQWLVVAGMRDVLVCLDAATGSERWRIDFVKQFGTPNPEFGFVSSPLIWGEAVYVQAGGGFAKIDKNSGKILWHVLQDGGGMYGSAFSSPARARLQDRDVLLVQTRTQLAAVDPDSGKVWWTQEVPAFRGMNILTPTVFEQGIFTSSHSGGTFYYAIDQERFGPRLAWQQKFDGYMTSPIVIGGHAYLLLKNQRFCCVDLKTGKQSWVTPKTYGKYWSMASQGNLILALDERGELLLIEANPEKFTLLDRRKISAAETWAHVAVCGEEIFVRDLQGLTLFRWRDIR